MRTLFVHGAGGPAVSQALLARLGAGLTPLTMPDPSAPDAEAWAARLRQALTGAPTVLVGHSVGGSVVLQVAAHAPPGLYGVITFGAPCWGADADWPAGPFSVPPHACPVPTHLLHGDADEVVPIAHLEAHRRVCRGARAHRCAGADHGWTTGELSPARAVLAHLRAT